MIRAEMASRDLPYAGHSCYRSPRRSWSMLACFSLLLCPGLLREVAAFSISPGMAKRPSSPVWGQVQRHVDMPQLHACRLARRMSLVPLAAQQAGLSDQEEGGILTLEEVEECARSFDVELRLSTLGPFYRVVAKNLRDGEAIGYSSGFVAPPLQVVHLDTMQIRRKYWKKLDGPQKFPLGCGVLLGAAVMSHAYASGCRKAELLAINDDERTHQRLKAFYKIAGFREVKEVTNEVQFLPDLLVWGGVGTRMDMEVETFLRKWAPAVRSKGKVLAPAEAK